MGGKRKPGGETATEEVKEKKPKKGAAQQPETPAEDVFDVSQYIVDTKMLLPDLIRVDEKQQFGEVTPFPVQCACLSVCLH